MMSLSVRELMSWLSRLAMASWSLLAIIAASDSTAPSARAQASRRLMASSACSRRRGLPTRGHAGGQFGHDARAFGGAHRSPARDLIECAPTSEANAGTDVEGADLDAGT